MSERERRRGHAGEREAGGEMAAFQGAYGGTAPGGGMRPEMRQGPPWQDFGTEAKFCETITDSS